MALRIAMIGTRGLPATHGGVESAVEGLSYALAARGHRVTVYGRRGYCGPLEREVTTDGLRGSVGQVVLAPIRSKHLEAISHTAVSTLHACLRRNYDVVHFHATGPALFSPATRLCGLPTVATIHGLDWRREKWGALATTVLRVGARMSATVPHETIVVSAQLRREIHQTYGRRSTHIPNGVVLDDLDIPPRPVPGLEPQRFVLFLARLVPEKQAHLLIPAFRAISTDMKLVIAGPALHEADYLQRLLALADGDPRIVFTGPRYGAEKNWLFRNARVFVQPSTLEGFPIAPLEAMASGTEVLVSDIPENLEAVTIDGHRYGEVFEVGNMDDLRRSLQVFVRSDNRITADASVIAREAFDWNIIAERTEAVYHAATRRGSGADPRPLPQPG